MERQERVLTTMYRGACFGEMALLSDDENALTKASCVAKDEPGKKGVRKRRRPVTYILLTIKVSCVAKGRRRHVNTNIGTRSYVLSSPSSFFFLLPPSSFLLPSSS